MKKVFRVSPQAKQRITEVQETYRIVPIMPTGRELREIMRILVIADMHLEKGSYMQHVSHELRAAALLRICAEEWITSNNQRISLRKEVA